MTLQLFGAASSPGCSNYGLKDLAKENSLGYPLGAQYIARYFYDGVVSAETVERGIQLAHEARVSYNNAVPASEDATDITT